MIGALLFAVGLLTLALGLLAIWHAGDKLREAERAHELAEESRRLAASAWARFSRVGPSPVTESSPLYRQ